MNNQTQTAHLFCALLSLCFSFDTISYCKGCVVVRMLESFLGQEDFARGIVTYIKKYKYANAVTADLWAVLGEVSGKDVSGMMREWTKQTGFPILRLEEQASEEEGVLTLRASQARFMADGPRVDGSPVWPVPVDFVLAGQSASEAVAKQVLAEREGVLKIDLRAAGVSGQPKWIKLNRNQNAMFRVQYPPRLFDALVEAVAARDPLLSPSDRLGVQSDAFALTRCGLLPTTQLLSLVRAYSREDDYTVWADLLGNLADVSTLLQTNPDTYRLFAAYVNKLLSEILAKVGWEKQADEAHTASLLRARIIAAAVKYADRATVDTALAKFAAFLGSGQAAGAVPASADEKDTLSPDLRSAVYAAAVREGGATGYASMRFLLSRVSMSEEKVRCLQALAASSDPALLRATLDFALSAGVRTQDGPSLIAAVSANRFGTRLCWEWSKANWEAICKKFGQSSSLSRIVNQCSNLTDAKDAEDVKAFFESHEHPGAERAVKQSIEKSETITMQHRYWFVSCANAAD